MKKMIRLVHAMFVLVLIIGNASALGISNANFGDVEQGKIYNQTVTLLNSPNDFDNNFVVTVDGAIKNWTKVSPSEFSIKKGNVQKITLTLNVPIDADLGEIKGSVIAEGKNTVPSSSGGGGANVGYAVATKSNIYATVIKPGAVASVEITGVEVLSSIPVGSVVRFTVTSKNNGDVATTANFKIDIKKGGKVVASIPDTPVDFTIGEEKTVKLFWDTQGVAEGGYDALVEANTIARGSEKTTSSTFKPVSVVIGENNSSSPFILVAGIVILIIIISIVGLKRRK